MSEERVLESEFGQGFAYCLALFMAHQHMDLRDEGRANLWFNGASDHLYDLKVPENFVLKEECEAWRDKVLDYGHGLDYLCAKNLKEKHIQWALEKCKKFLMAWDRQNGIDVIKGTWE